jgi:hypothetical protein
VGAGARAPRADFVARLERRLRTIDPRGAAAEPEPAPDLLARRRPGPGLALGAAAVVVAVLMLLLPGADTDRQLDITGRPAASAPDQLDGDVTTVVPGATTTTVTGAPADVPPSPTTTAVVDRTPARPSPLATDRPTDTTRPARPEPTRPDAPEVLRLQCSAGPPEGRQAIACAWSQSSVAAFASYRLWRASGTEAKQVVFMTAERSTTRYVDRPAPGVGHRYQVEALDAQGRVIGRSPIVEATVA